MRKVVGLLTVVVLAVGMVAIAQPVEQKFQDFGALVLHVPGMNLNSAVPQNSGSSTGIDGIKWGCFFTCTGVPCLVGGNFKGFYQHSQGKTAGFYCNDMQALPGFGLEGLLIKPWGACGAGNPGWEGFIRINKNGNANAHCG